jgi:hypothetical protein
MRTLLVGAAALVPTFAMLSGCSDNEIKMHPLRGTVQVSDGDVGILLGSHVELMQEVDPLIRPSGKITAGGKFSVETLFQGRVLPGAPEGKYKARLILGDESDEGVPKRTGNPVHRRFLDFATSGLSFTVPSSDYTVTVSSK